MDGCRNPTSPGDHHRITRKIKNFGIGQIKKVGYRQVYTLCKDPVGSPIIDLMSHQYIQIQVIELALIGQSQIVIELTIIDIVLIDTSGREGTDGTDGTGNIYLSL